MLTNNNSIQSPLEKFVLVQRALKYVNFKQESQTKTTSEVNRGFEDVGIFNDKVTILKTLIGPDRLDNFLEKYGEITYDNINSMIEVAVNEMACPNIVGLLKDCFDSEFGYMVLVSSEDERLAKVDDQGRKIPNSADKLANFWELCQQAGWGDFAENVMERSVLELIWQIRPQENKDVLDIPMHNRRIIGPNIRTIVLSPNIRFSSLPKAISCFEGLEEIIGKHRGDSCDNVDYSETSPNIHLRTLETTASKNVILPGFSCLEEIHLDGAAKLDCRLSKSLEIVNAPKSNWVQILRSPKVKEISIGTKLDKEQELKLCLDSNSKQQLDTIAFGNSNNNSKDLGLDEETMKRVIRIQSDNIPSAKASSTSSENLLDQTKEKDTSRN